MANFDKAHKITSKIEGGYVNDPLDKGGETYKGIARKYHPDWLGWELIDSYTANMELKRGQYISNIELDDFVDSFYKEKFWDVNRLDDVDDQDIANELFDTGVNMGVGTAAKMLQEALNLLNRNEKDYLDITVDGKVGRMTIMTTNSLCVRHPKALFKTLNGLQFERYVKICKRKPSQERFFRGWLLRV